MDFIGSHFISGPNGQDQRVKEGDYRGIQQTDLDLRPSVSSHNRRMQGARLTRLSGKSNARPSKKRSGILSWASQYAVRIQGMNP